MIRLHLYAPTLRATLALSLLSACAPSLSSQMASVKALAKLRQLPALREGVVDLSTPASVARLLEHPLDADTAVRIALLNNRELRAHLRELGIPASELLSAGTIANPGIEFEVLPERDSRYELRVEYDLTSLLMAPLRRRAAADELEAARLATASDIIQLGYDVRTRFYAFQAADERRQLAEKSLEALAAARDAAEALVNAGNVPALNAASHIAAYERARAELGRLQLEAAERREDMQRSLGLRGDETQWQTRERLHDAPEQLDLPHDFEHVALDANLDLRAAKKHLEGLAKQSGIAQTEGWLPEVVADAHALRLKSDSGEREAWRWGAGVRLEVPLFDRKQGRLGGIESRFDAGSERYQGLAIAVRSAARDATNRLTSSQARARQYKTVIVPAQRAVLAQTLLQYNAMQLGIFQLLSAQRELLNTEFEYVDTLRDYWDARAEVEALTRGRVVRPADLSTAQRAQGEH